MLEHNPSIAALPGCGGRLLDLLTSAGNFGVLGSISNPAFDSTSQNVC